MGGSANEGITSGLDKPKRGLVDEPGGYAGDIEKIQQQRDLINSLAPRTQRPDRSFNNFLINMGLDLVSRPKSGNIFQQLGSSAKEPFQQFQKAGELRDAYAQQGESEDRKMITDLVKNLDEGTLSRARKLAKDMMAAGMTKEDGTKFTYEEALAEATGSILYGVKKEPGELKAETIDIRAGTLIKQDDDLGYDSAVAIANAAQKIFDGKVEGVTKEDIDTDQIYIETDVLGAMTVNEESGVLTLPADVTDTSIGFDQYVEGMVYFNYRDGTFYRKQGKQFLPIEQKEN
jgi:hypothetical protein